VNRRARAVYFAPRTWIGRLLAVAVGAALLVAAVLFLAVALIAGALIAAFVIARAFWLMRKAEKERAREFLDADYRVEPEETPQLRSRTSDNNGGRDA